MATGFALGALACEGLHPGPEAVVVAVPDGDTLILDSGVKVRLTGIQAPRLPLGRQDVAAWPLGEESRLALEALVLDETVALHFGGARMDRHGRSLAQVFTAEGEWVQSRMVTVGLARVYSFPDNRACVGDLLRAEASARADRRGLWRDGFYALRDAGAPGTLAGRAGLYELVEGRVVAAARSGSRIFLNFGRYWKEDFTVVIERPAQALFEAEGVDLLAMEGTVVRVRGWIDVLDGPRIEVTHPEQIEVLAVR